MSKSAGKNTKEEIDITPSMIEAAKHALEVYHPEFDNLEQKLVEIYSSMQRAKISRNLDL